MEAEVALAGWRPKPAWADQIREPVRTLLADPSRAGPWASLAMMLGDTQGPGLCFIVCQHARSLKPTPAEDQLLCTHQGVAAWGLGFAKAAPVRMSELAGRAATALASMDQPRVQAWLERQLASFDGQIARAAMFSLCLAGERAGVLSGPKSPALADYCEPSRWQLRNKGEFG
jgi:hypothetical protein